MRIGVDTGGTFTDAVTDDGRVMKVPSTPEDPAMAVAEAVGSDRPDELRHGTTVATNALLERRGGRIALVTTPGFTDIIEIARQVRPSLYDQWADRPVPLVPRELRFESATDVPDHVDSVAVCLLHADLDPSGEREAAAELEKRGVDVTCSHEVSPQFREYERTVTTAANAYLRRPCRSYLQRLGPLADAVLVATSAGGLIPIEEAVDRPVALLLSGPAAGVAAAAEAGRAAGFDDVVTFDMGGTSTDVCLVIGGRPAPAAQRMVAGLPIRMPSLDVHTIGAGGGSIASIDAGGALVVGPRSAGAVPGPACYGRGGTQPTVTDADLVLGRIPAEAAFPGLGRLDAGAAEEALRKAGVDAAGVVAVVDDAMVRAVRAVTVERGVDPRELALVAFGGAGPLHACAVADALEMRAVVVPTMAGVLSAVGLLGAPRQVDLVSSWGSPFDVDGAERAAVELGQDAARRLGAGAEVETALDCRYAGQSHELTVAKVADFPDEHRRRNGFVQDAPIEVVGLRATARLASNASMKAGVGVGGREGAKGPVVLAEADCTVWVPEGWSADVVASGAWVLTR
jgi:N-methylhydantoinase A/oxoprolinase/acetone carboxylase beta subunit